MLIDKLSNNDFIKGFESVGITFNLSSESEYDIDFVRLVKKKKIVSILESKTNIKNLNDLTNLLSLKTPVFLNIMGKGLIHRKFESSLLENAGNKEIINNIFPNADQDEFLIQKSLIKDEVFISLIRKKTIDELIEHFKSKGISILNITIGPFALNSIIRLIENVSDTNQVLVKNLEIGINDNLINNLNIVQNVGEIIYKIGDDEIHQDSLVSFASAFSFYLPNHSVSIDIESIQQSKEEFVYKRVFSILGWSILLFTFIILLINYLFFEHYNSKLNILSMEYSKRTEEFNQFKELSKQLALKEKFVAENNLLETSRFSYYSDRLALIIPSNITLNELYLNPLTSELQKNKEINVISNFIVAKGIINKNSLLNDWIKNIEKEHWVEEVEIIKFFQKDKNSYANFEIGIKVKKSNQK